MVVYIQFGESWRIISHNCALQNCKMNVENSTPNSFPMVLQTHGKRNVGSITILPEEIIFNILVLLPAEILYDVMRYVCHQWYMIIHDPKFVSTHLLQSSSTFIVEKPVQLLDVRKSDIELTWLNYRFLSNALSSCNGLILRCDTKNKQLQSTFYIANPVTHRTSRLPPLVWRVFSREWCGLAFAASSNVYKVIVICENCDLLSEPVIGCAILTAGVYETWRFLSYESLDTFEVLQFLGRPIACTEFLCWVSDQMPSILILDIETESFKHIQLPKAYDSKDGRLYFLQKGNSISLWHVHGDFSMDVWVLKDHRTEEWAKLPDMQAEVIRREVENIPHQENKKYLHPDHLLIPKTWIGDGERILFHFISFGSHFFVYNVKSNNFVPFGWIENNSFLLPFTRSLTWF